MRLPANMQSQRDAHKNLIWAERLVSIYASFEIFWTRWLSARTRKPTARILAAHAHCTVFTSDRRALLVCSVMERTRDLVLLLTLVNSALCLLPQMTHVHSKFEYKYSFKGPYLIDSKGRIPFWNFGGSESVYMHVCLG